MVKIVTILFLSIIAQTSFAQADFNKKFLVSKGKWKYPQTKFSIESINTEISPPSKGITFVSDSSYPVKAVFDGIVILVKEYDSVFMVVTKYGDYFIGYSNLSKASVKKNDKLKTGQAIGNMGIGLDDKYIVELQLSKNQDYIEISNWFEKKMQ